MSKTPYEIRLEILKMAKEHLDNMHLAQAEFAKQAFSQALALNKATFEQWKEFSPASYSIDDVMKKATELYAFINKKD